MKSLRNSLIFAFLLSFSPNCPAYELVRVKLLSGQQSVNILCAETTSLYDPSTAQDIAVTPSFAEYSITPSDQGLRLMQKNTDGGGFSFNLPYEVVIEPWSEGTVSVNGREYRGSIYVKLRNGMLASNAQLEVINIISIDDYVRGTVKAEISPEWPEEMIKAHVVAARTYVFYQMQNRAELDFDVESGIMSQVYWGVNGEDSASNRLVSETAGEYLVYRDAVAQVFYHSCCGGYTEDSLDVWGISIPYITNVRCPFCKDSPRYSWEKKISAAQVQEALKKNGIDIGSILGIYPRKKSRTERVQELSIKGSNGEKRMSGDNFRKIMGYSVIPSTMFTVEQKIRDELIFRGRGYGHGVGLCQWGAREMAVNGYGYREILKFYFPGTKVKKLTNN